ncbi:MAG TPA: hypothetical protein VMU34_16700 [Mycobacterium sp.]|nr:hypothetical protein [Mycobacterium sp.]
MSAAIAALVSAARRAAVPGYALGLVIAVTAPLLAPGYLLLRDAVSTPRSYLSDDALGLSESAPRALPQDFAVAVFSHVVDGGLVVKTFLIGGLWLAGWGAARLSALVVPDAGAGGQYVAATIAIWNPYVAERLLQGHWSLLVGYGCLPWVATAMLRLRRLGPGDPGRSVHAAGWALVCWIALAGLTATGLMLAATVALVCAVVPGRGAPRRVCAALGLGVAVVAALPWLLGSALGESLQTTPAGVVAFAARAEPGLGTLGSLAALGGIWNAEAVPGWRTTAFAVVGSVILWGVVAAGVPTVWRRPPALALLLLAAVAVLIPAAMATGPGIGAVEAIVHALPGFAVVRDGQKWVALAMPGYTVAGAGAVATLRRWMPAPAAAAGLCVALIAVLADLGWGVSGGVVSVRYPPGWAAVAAAINADPRPVAVLPADVMRRFAWAGPAPVLDPLPRWVRARVLSSGDLTISGRVVPGEGARARAVQQLLLDGTDPQTLTRAGIGWIVVESGTSGETDSAATTLRQMQVTYRDADLVLYRAGGNYPGAPGLRRAIMIAVHVGWLAVLVTGAVGAATAGLRLRRRR